jgi:predicted short-subunit dehydrogenase-like oxidoreductase (DUF2520 family)
VATHLAVHFQKAGHEVTCIYSRTEASARRLAERVGAQGTCAPPDVPRDADFYMLCVPDGAVSAVSGIFAGYGGIWLHCAGALPLDVVAIHERYGVLYPLQTFSGDLAPALSGTPFLIEGSTEEVTAEIAKLAASVSRTVRQVDTPSRFAVHLAAVFANNFTNHMVHVAQRILEAHGIDRQLLVPLLEETFRKLSEMSAADAQTGPARRDDRETMERHLRMLEAYPEWKNLYTFISRDIRDLHGGKKKKQPSGHNTEDDQF